MKYNINFIFIPLLIASSMNPMENKENILAELTVINKPLSAQYITKDRVLISNQNCCSIIDPFYNKEIKQLLKSEDCKNHLFSTSIHPNKKRIALGYDDVISIYNIQTDKFERKRTEEHWYADYCAFNPLDNETIFILYKRDERSMLVKYNYFADKKEVEWFYQMSCFSLDPFKNHLFLTQDSEKLQIRDTNDLSSRIAQQETKDSYSLSTYSSDGKLIALNHPLNIVVKTHNLQECKLALPQKTIFEYYKQIKFFPGKPLLAILSAIRFEHNEFCSIHYCDVLTNTTLHTTHLPKYSPIYDFDFSPDKTKLLLTLHDKCIVMSLPIELFKKEIFRYWILKNYQKNNLEIAIPNEIIHYILSFFFK